MNLELIMVRRGPKREPVDRGPIIALKAPIMTHDNIRLDIDGTTVPGGLPIDPSEVTWRLFYGDPVKPDIEFVGSIDEEVIGKHWKAGGQALRNLERSNGCTVNVKLHAGTPGTTYGAIEAECRGEKKRIEFRAD